jgi:8-oxo-dGTP pyrophosphatase MutT (NUDIX family)
MIKYVLGVILWREKVLTIYKTKGPDVIREKFNGIGGKIENNESPVDAMIRECYEETGINVPLIEWDYIGPFAKDNYQLNVFWTRLYDEINYQDVKNTEDGDEYLKWFNTLDVKDSNDIEADFKYFVGQAIFIEGYC